LNQQTPDAIIAPWLEHSRPEHLWVIGDQVPPVISDYQSHTRNRVDCLTADQIRQSAIVPNAAIIVFPLVDQDDLLVAGALRNLLIGDILCFANETITPESLYAFAFRRGAHCHEKNHALLSFHYSLATYNHTRAWNNPKFWANPENWNKYWW
jgi:hypothetical protein